MTEAVRDHVNCLLRVLSPGDRRLVEPYLTEQRLEKGALLYEPGDPINTVYFPHDSVISLMTLMRDGSAIESSTIGREGAFGLTAAVAPKEALSRAVVQVPGDASRMPAAKLRAAYRESAELRSMVDRHSEALFGHAIQSVACNALHSVEARFCRWLLCCRDRIDTDRVSLTQEFLADMLGVQRTTVTAVARVLQSSGLIHYRRGVIDILDRRALEQTACECYGGVRALYARLLPECH